MIITISGEAGSGKSSVAKLLAEHLGFPHYSAGDAQREIANEKEMTIAELGRLEAEDDSIDRVIDDKMAEICRREENAVVDAWLGAYFAPHSIKIFLDADIDVRAKRRMSQHRKEESFNDLDEAKKIMFERADVNRKRWLKYYGFNHLDKNNYDYVIKSDIMNQNEIVKRIIKLLKRDKHI